ncbi:RNA polymerase sigma factor SigE [Tersicoccus sp. Bi-70]|uniref:RNA polymerase sigma factor SigE n=1 Tax=Tersicoccus sp. Bi-70 TaxID=1897634 RepID=UPI000976280D|nr:RNA polymerase sigma factor SigE [Tersicoccus sp. Bi-70]OMH35279.1 RNA polymerase sigma factor SigE [Tersicoccus sp. Bi-70]
MSARPSEVPGAIAAPIEAVPAFDELVREHRPRVYRLAYRLSGNRQDAEDLVQETFLRVYRSLDTFQPGSLSGWMHRITTNLFLDSARRRSRVRFEALGDDGAERLPSSEPGPERSFEFSHLDRDVQAALNQLSPSFRAAVVLSDLEGYSYDEVADALGLKLGTVRSRIHRGRAKLRVALAHRDPGHRPSARPALGLSRIAGVGPA